MSDLDLCVRIQQYKQNEKNTANKHHVKEKSSLIYSLNTFQLIFDQHKNLFIFSLLDEVNISNAESTR